MLPLHHTPILPVCAAKVDVCRQKPSLTPTFLQFCSEIRRTQGVISPKNFEEKLGFDAVRNHIRGLCLSTLGGDEIGRMKFEIDAAELDNRLRCLSEMMAALHSAQDFPLDDIQDLRTALSGLAIAGRYLEESGLWALRQTLRQAHSVVEFLKHTEAGELVYPHLAKSIPAEWEFTDVVKAIDRVLGEHGHLRDDASPELLKTRGEIDSLKRSTSILLSRILRSAQANGIVEKDVSPVLRDGRQVIPIAAAAKRMLRGLIHDESASGKTLFVEPQEVVELGNRQRRLELEESRIVIGILKEVADQIRPAIAGLLEVQHFLGHIDALRAKALYADAIGATIVYPSARPAMDFIEARNPILEIALGRHGRKMNPLNIRLDEENRMLLISGPNAGGKSVCLKTAGLLQYMLQCGLALPVKEGSRGGMFGSIFLDIGDEQSLQDDLSTYSSRLIGYKAMLRRGDEKSLLLIDEFGSGTEPRVGASIAQAVLGGFLKKKMWGILTTHYQNLKDFAAKTAGIQNAAMAYKREELRPLYELLVGEPGSAYALEMARKIGLPAEVISEAENGVGEDYVMSDRYLQAIAKDKLFWAQKRGEVKAQQQRLDSLLQEQQTSLESLAKERRAILDEAKAQAEEMLKQSRATIENAIRTIRQSQAEQAQTKAAREEVEGLRSKLAEDTEKDELIERRMRQIEERRKRREKRREEKPTAAQAETKPKERPLLTEGSFVQIDGRGSVLCIRQIKGDKALVSGESVQMWVDMSRLVPAEAPKPQPRPQMSRDAQDALSLMHKKRVTFKYQIDVRGLNGEEALDCVSNFIDDAILLQASPLRILHGTGTGYLRRVIREYLGSISQVSRFADEDVRFGGAGITVVTLSC